MSSNGKPMNEEKRRLEEDRRGERPWRRWGPYLSERQWGTVREDYSPHGTAWDYFPHDHARSRAYRWGEDGIAGISDDEQRLCLALALWNGKDPTDPAGYDLILNSGRFTVDECADLIIEGLRRLQAQRAGQEA